MEEKKVVKREVKKKKIKKSKKKRLFGFLMFLLIVGGVFGFLFFFPSCSILDTMTKGFSTRYEFSNQYTASSKYQSNGYLDSININWRDGSVNFYTHDSDEILIEEVPNKTITEKYMMHYNYKETDKYGHYILVQYSKSGKWNFNDLKKDLNVYIPSKDNLKVTIHTYNADIKFDLGETTISEMQIQSNHGNVDGTFSSANKVQLIGSTSKKVKDGYHYNITSTGKVNDFRYTTSQSMTLKLNEVSYLDGGGVWGKISIDTNKCYEASIKLASYSLDYYVGTTNKVKLNDKYSNGGDVNLYINKDASYNIYINRKEYKNNDGNVIKKETNNNICDKISDTNYKINDGKNSIDITISGTLNLLENEA